MVASHFNFDDIARDISTLEARLKGTGNYDWKSLWLVL